MKLKSLILLFFICGKIISQNDSSLKVGQKAQPFILRLSENSIQSFAMPYMKRVVLLHFWSSNVPKSMLHHEHFKRLLQRYKDAQYKGAEGFEIVNIAVQTDKAAWLKTIQTDSLADFTNGIAIRGYQDEVCQKYHISTVPNDILIDEKGMIVALNPRIVDIENILDEKRNTQPLKKDVVGFLAQSSNKKDPIKYCRLYLFNYYGDSLQKTVTSDRGSFIFSDVKVNQEFVLKVDNKVDIVTSDPIALYTPNGEFLMDGRTKNNGFVFSIPARSSYKLTQSDSNSTVNYLGQIDVIKHLTFFTNGEGLTPKDEQELRPILLMLQNNKSLMLELTTHTDARMDAKYAKELTSNQAKAIKAYFEKKGIDPQRIKTIPKGNLEIRKICEGQIDCREEDHQLNRRVEFLLYNN